MKMRWLAGLLALSMCSTAMADSAADIYKAKCKGCHGEDGKAQTKVGKKEKMADISTAEWQSKHSDEDIRTVISDGSKDNAKMKPFKDKLSAEEIASLVKYIRTLKK
jgi:cytochrome c6